MGFSDEVGTTVPLMILERNLEKNVFRKEYYLKSEFSFKGIIMYLSALLVRLEGLAGAGFFLFLDGDLVVVFFLVDGAVCKRTFTGS